MAKRTNHRETAVEEQYLNNRVQWQAAFIGGICGVLTLNDQIEIVIKFHDEMRQFTKEEFYAQVKLLDK